MKLFGSRSSKDKSRSSVKKKKKGRVDLSEDPQRHVQQKVPDAPTGDVQQSVLPVVPNGTVQQPASNGVSDDPVQQDMPHDVSENPEQQTVSPAEPQTFSYPKTELTSAQQAALQNVLYKKELVSEKKKQTEALNQHYMSQQPERKTLKKNPDMHAYADRKLKKKSSPLVGVIITLVIIGVLTSGIYIGWTRWVQFNTAPTADPVDVTILIGETAAPRDFVRNVNSDFEIISVDFVEAPNFLAHTSQNVRIRIMDEYANIAVFDAKLMIQINTSPPVLNGTAPILSRMGDPILYLFGITAHDDLGRDLTDEIEVDSSRVNYNAVGDYSVVYRVKDLTGLETVIIETVTVINVDVYYVHEQVDRILDEILKEGMTQLDIVIAIHSWVINNISYAQTIGGTDTIYGDAYRALRDRGGNCFNFYAISEMMLTRAGVPNMQIDRIPDTETRHRWSLVNPDELGWHHFDTTPTRLQWGMYTAFFTDSQARDFTRQFYEYNETEDYFTYDPELYPEVVQ
jgi:hypothetical protein